jgi:hypothetical protein
VVTSSSFERTVGRVEEGRVTASKRNKFGEEGVRLGWDGMGKVEPLTRVSAVVKTLDCTSKMD